MLKGVNKLIIEVNNPGSEYFERAIFFVKPGKGDISAVNLANGAEEVMRKQSIKKSPRKKRGGRLACLLVPSVSALIGAFIYALITSVL